ncbi:hypothetical protein [Sphingorhabdus sp.]|jgi:hypothetical protein|uniref:hypothetical protein n=1 Tax=Sphingorhabdus sp. TaxID=1902408 RepID=UPI0037C5334B
MGGTSYQCFHCNTVIPHNVLHQCGGKAIEQLFDQRPGDLEATRGLVDPRAAFMVWAERQEDGWKVRVKIDQALSSEDAFKMAAEIQRLADLIEGRAEF